MEEGFAVEAFRRLGIVVQLKLPWKFSFASLGILLSLQVQNGYSCYRNWVSNLQCILGMMFEACKIDGATPKPSHLRVYVLSCVKGYLGTEELSIVPTVPCLLFASSVGKVRIVIISSFLVEEHKIMKKVLKIQKAKEKTAF
ncbi:hypothetical protein M8C21_014070 [Ambrosia artemisiifolia]|uniref:Uncharacterized protein n=1 Tax=Ambrosia artemisiifolia TaxID=4212 RepID=A0AAD5CXT8_AMBAR|nr:hypothetical protein M8C21_014070 [Ambrosia artemisiifolia]